MEHFLPKGLLTHFTLKSVNENFGDDPILDGELELHIDEKNKLYIEDAEEYESKGFGSAVRIQDFPIRGKSVYLLIRRRKWRHKETGKVVQNRYDLTTDGTRMTQELSDFLKEAGRNT